MPDALTPTFTPLSNPLVWFANVDAFNSFIQGITYTITYTNLPDATTTQRGAVKKATLANYTPETVTPGYFTLTTEESPGVVVETQLPLRADYDALKTKVDNCAAKLDALLDAMSTAGQITLT